MVWLLSGVAVYAVVGLAAVFALCLAAASADEANERQAAEHSAMAERELETVLANR
jgi:uncharacterized membrane protein YuzA (DUF378 family)